MAREHPPSRVRRRRRERSRRRDVTPGDFDSPPAQQEDGAIAFSPDGKEIAFVSNREGSDREAWTTNHDVWLVPVTGGAAQEADAESGRGHAAGLLARRHRRCSCARSGAPASNRIAGISTPTIARRGAKRTVFESPDLSVGDFALSPDGSAIWFIAADSRDATNLYTVPAAGGTPKRVVRGRCRSRAPQPGAGFVVFSKSSLTAPRGDLPRGRRRQRRRSR